MSFLRIGAVAAACMFLWACSPGADDGSASASRPPAARPASAQAYPVLAPPVTRAEVLAWAESGLSAHFNGPSQDGTYEVYDYRYYPQTGNYIGFDGDRVHVLGPVSGGSLLYLGHMLDFACLARADLCALDRPRSPMQVKWQAVAQSPGGYSIFASTGSPPTTWFYATRSMPSSPRATPQGFAMDTVVSAHAPTGGAPVPAAFLNCEAPWLRVFVDERGHPADWCERTTYRTHYIGDAIYVSVISGQGQPIARYELTSVTEEAIHDRNITTYLRDSEDIHHAFQSLQDGSRVFAASSRGGTTLARRLNGLVYLLNPDGSPATSATALVPLPKANDPATPAATLEDVYGPLPVDGGVKVVNGNRARFPSVEAPAFNMGAIEIGGRVYKAYYQLPDPTPRPFQVFLNSFARDSVLMWGLAWLP